MVNLRRTRVVGSMFANGPQGTASVAMPDPALAAIQAEILWTAKVVASNYSAESCQAVADLFRRMAPGLNTAFSLGPTKATCIF